MHKGLPVPYVVGQDGFGKPLFSVNNVVKVAQVAAHQLCGQCGESLGMLLVLLGGPDEVESRLFTEPPMHPGCAEYALASCPHLVKGYLRPSGDYSLPESDIHIRHGMEGMEIPEKFGLYFTRDYKVCTQPGGLLGFIPTDEVRIRWFTAGKEIQIGEASA